MLTSILTFLVVINLLIFIHELGHLWAAKARGIPASDFAVGFGPALISFKWGETTYKLCALPLGGYVKFEGEGALDSRYPIGGRMLTVAAGVIMNLVLAFVLFAAIPMGWGTRASFPATVGQVRTAEMPESAAGFEALEAGTELVRVAGREVETWKDVMLAMAMAPSGENEIVEADGTTHSVTLPDGQTAREKMLVAVLPRRPAVVGAVNEGSPAAAAGLEPGDRIVAVEGRKVGDWTSIQSAVAARPGEVTSLTVSRGGERHHLSAELGTRDVEGRTVGALGVAAGRPLERTGLGPALAYSVREVRASASLIWESLAAIAEGNISARQMGGPVAIADIADDMRQSGWNHLVHFTALISVNLALLNFLPFPALDGGHFLLLIVESVRRRPVPDRWIHGINRFGMAILMALMVVIVANDVLRLFGI